MNLTVLKEFARVGLEIAKVAIPAIGTVEMAVKKLKSGKDKKEAVLEIIKASPMIAEVLANKEVIDEKLFAQGISKVNDGYVDIMNSLRPAANDPK